MAMRAKVNSSMNGSDASSSFFGKFLLPGLFHNLEPIRVPLGGESSALSSPSPSPSLVNTGSGIGSELVKSSRADDADEEFEDETVEPSAILAVDHTCSDDERDCGVNSVQYKRALSMIDEIGEDESSNRHGR
jgi:hypothetical protein